MHRDGATKSIWQYNIEDYTPKHQSLPASLFDVVIVGGGITGITTALLLQKAGKQCLLLEAATLGFGTTGGTTAHLNTLMDNPYSVLAKNFGEDNAHLVADGAKEALALIKEHVDAYQIDCKHVEQVAYMFAQDEKQEKELAEITEATAKAGVAIEYVNEIPIPVPFTKAIKAEGQGKFHPISYVFALAKEFEELGGMILQHTRVTDWSDGDVVSIETSAGKVEGRQLIFATHIPPGVNVLHLRCAPYRTYAIAVELEDGNYPDNLIYDMYDPYHYYRTQNINGKDYLIAGGEDHKTAHEENTEVCFMRLEAYVRKYFKVKNVAFKWSSQYFEPADGLPYIGHMPGKPNGNIYVATGFGGNGMTYGTLSAIILRDLLTGVEGKYADLFTPNRLKPVAGFTNFVSENADVVKEFVKGLFTKEKIESLSNLAHGEGKVVSYDGEKLALYKDEQGGLHAVRSTCTHMACSVSWNVVEKSWDCPCHGARYDCDGKMLTGPASKDLKRVDLEELANK